jgi:hypothetical protein
MATIENLANLDALREHMRSLNEPELLAHQLSQQGAIHVVTFLLVNGCRMDRRHVQSVDRLHEGLARVRQLLRRGSRTSFRGWTPEGWGAGKPRRRTSERCGRSR